MQEVGFPDPTIGTMVTNEQERRAIRFGLSLALGTFNEMESDPDYTGESLSRVIERLYDIFSSEGVAISWRKKPEEEAEEESITRARQRVAKDYKEG